jgi:pilus assembly protein CpaB
VILSNVQVITAGTRIEQDQDKGKPMQVTVVTLLVYPEQSERLALASTEGKIQLALRNPLDQGAPETPGMKQAVLLGVTKAAPPARTASHAGTRKTAGGPVTQGAAAAAAAPTVEMIRGDKRTAEVIK